MSVPTDDSAMVCWHLSTNRANSVVLQLKKLDIQESRMGAADCSNQRPVVAS